MVLAKSCGITSVVAMLAPLLVQSESTVRQRLREWSYPSKRKKGTHRQAVEVSQCFAPLLGWVMSWWDRDEHRRALAMDASTLSDRFTVLAISVLYRGCAIAVAWKIVRSNEPGSWEPYWKDLLSQLAQAVPPDWMVIVLADRGLYAKWLYEHLVGLSWHPFLRITRIGKVRPEGESSFRWLASVVPEVGMKWRGVVDCFAGGACPLGRVLCRGVAHRHGFGTRGSQYRVVQHAHLDRMWVQRYQTWRRASASNQDEGSRACSALVGRDCSGDLLGRERGRASRSNRDV
jgi:hypothetical protein